VFVEHTPERAGGARVVAALLLELPEQDERGFHTVGGFAMHSLGRIPTVADHFEASGYRFEVVDMDRNRVDKMLVARLPDPQPVAVDEP